MITKNSQSIKLKLLLFITISVLFITSFILIVFVIKYDKKFKITFDINGGNGSNFTVVVDDGNQVTQPTQDPIKEGYLFIDWSVSKDKYEAYDFNTKITKDITLYANYNTQDNLKSVFKQVATHTFENLVSDEYIFYSTDDAGFFPSYKSHLNFDNTGKVVAMEDFNLNATTNAWYIYSVFVDNTLYYPNLNNTTTNIKGEYEYTDIDVDYLVNEFDDLLAMFDDLALTFKKTGNVWQSNEFNDPFGGNETNIYKIELINGCVTKTEKINITNDNHIELFQGYSTTTQSDISPPKLSDSDTWINRYTIRTIIDDNNSVDEYYYSQYKTEYMENVFTASKWYDNIDYCLNPNYKLIGLYLDEARTQLIDENALILLEDNIKIYIKTAPTTI